MRTLTHDVNAHHAVGNCSHRARPNNHEPISAQSKAASQARGLTPTRRPNLDKSRLNKKSLRGAAAACTCGRVAAIATQPCEFSIESRPGIDRPDSGCIVRHPSINFVDASKEELNGRLRRDSGVMRFRWDYFPSTENASNTFPGSALHCP